MVADRRYAFPDAMVFAGVYVDRSAPPPPGAGCAPFLANHRSATWRKTIATTINHPWSMYPDQPTCGPCDHKEKRPAPGPGHFGAADRTSQAESGSCASPTQSR